MTALFVVFIVVGVAGLVCNTLRSTPEPSRQDEVISYVGKPINIPATPSQEDLDAAALDILYPLPHASAHYPESEATLQRGDAWVAEKKAWAQTLLDPRVKAAYLKWINHAERSIAENREENRTHAKAQASREWREKQVREETRIAPVRDTMPKPPK